LECCNSLKSFHEPNPSEYYGNNSGTCFPIIPSFRHSFTFLWIFFFENPRILIKANWHKGFPNSLYSILPEETQPSIRVQSADSRISGAPNQYFFRILTILVESKSFFVHVFVLQHGFSIALKIEFREKAFAIFFGIDCSVKEMSLQYLAFSGLYLLAHISERCTSSSFGSTETIFTFFPFGRLSLKLLFLLTVFSSN
jgi:hypothetical protein